MKVLERVSTSYVRPESALDISACSLRDAYARWKRNEIREDFGKWICKLYLKEGSTFPALWYQRNSGVAYNLALTEILGDRHEDSP